MVWTSEAKGGRVCGEKKLEKEKKKKERFVDAAKEDMQVLGVTEEEAGERTRWRKMIGSGDP